MLLLLLLLCIPYPPSVVKCHCAYISEGCFASAVSNERLMNVALLLVYYWGRLQSMFIMCITRAVLKLWVTIKQCRARRTPLQSARTCTTWRCFSGDSVSAELAALGQRQVQQRDVTYEYYTQKHAHYSSLICVLCFLRFLHVHMHAPAAPGGPQNKHTHYTIHLLSASSSPRPCTSLPTSFKATPRGADCRLPLQAASSICTSQRPPSYHSSHVPPVPCPSPCLPPTWVKGGLRGSKN